MTKARKLTAKQIYQVFSLLKEVCSSEDGKAIYHKGWSDRHIALELNVHPGQVAHIRTNEFGPLAKVSRTTLHVAWEEGYDAGYRRAFEFLDTKGWTQERIDEFRAFYNLGAFNPYKGGE